MGETFRVWCCLLFIVNHVCSTEPPYTVVMEKAEVYSLPELPYAYNGLEPWIDEATIRAHYEGHHDAYRKKMNNFLQQWREYEPQNNFVTEPIVNIQRYLHKVPDMFQTKLRNNLGGYINHCLYWAVMAPNAEGSIRVPDGELLQDIKANFGSFDGFKAAFTAASLDLFGSGYVWLVRHRSEPRGQQLSIVSTTNQDSPLSEGVDPILVIDIWEHAYYLKYQFRRAQYIDNWWHLVDWTAVDRLDKFWIQKRDPPKKDEF